MIAASLLLLALLPAPATGESATPAATLVGQVIEMLDAKVSPRVIERWIDKQDLPLPRLSPADLIRLTRAGAPERLIARMVDLSGEAGPATTARTAAPLPPSAAPSRPDTAASPPPSSPGACCLLDMEIDYRAVEGVDGEDERPGRDLFAYLDGEYLARLSSRGDIGMSEPLRFAIQVGPGPHRLRLARQRHERRRRGEYAHEVRISPHSVDFEVGDDRGRWKLELAWKESLFSSARKPPLSWTLLHDGRRVAGERETGVAKEEWPWLCEVAKRKGARRDCVAWADLWPGSGADGWGEIMEKLAAEKFRPPPAPYLERQEP